MRQVGTEVVFPIFEFCSIHSAGRSTACGAFLATLPFEFPFATGRLQTPSGDLYCQSPSSTSSSTSVLLLSLFPPTAIARCSSTAVLDAKVSPCTVWSCGRCALLLAFGPPCVRWSCSPAPSPGLWKRIRAAAMDFGRDQRCQLHST